MHLIGIGCFQVRDGSAYEKTRQAERYAWVADGLVIALPIAAPSVYLFGAIFTGKNADSVAGG